MKPAKVTTESPELADRFDRVLRQVVEALEGNKFRYAFIGGIASHGLGRPRSTQDIDIFVRPEDAELALRALAKQGFKTEKTDPVWLYKAFKDDVLVDVIFKSKGEIYFDHEMYERMTTAEYHGLRLKFVSPEDLIIIKAIAHSEATPGHWHDALALLSRSEIDWEYLVRRGRRAPRRLLSLLLYAQSSDVWVPKSVIDQLYLVVFGDMPPMPISAARLQSQPQRVQAVPASREPLASHTSRNLRLMQHRKDPNAIAKLRERLAEDARTNELDIQIEHEEGRFLLRGEVLSTDRRDAIMSIARELFPDCEIECQLRILDYPEPKEAEEVK